LIWGARKDLDVGPMASAREQMLNAARDEYRRLLYVGMTRAAERLVVCATKGVNKVPEGCWYDLVCAALKPLAVEDRDVDGDKTWRLRKEPLSTESGKSPDGPAAIVVPEWLRNTAAPQKPRRRIVRPSDTGDDDAHRAGDPGDRDKALRRGTLLHRLMQSLPDIAPERRAAGAKSYLTKQPDVSDADRAELTIHAMRILDDARFKPLFAPGSRAEISIVGELTLPSETIAVAGQIDRLAVTDDDVLIADYKTNHPPPARIADVPPAYVRQLALYRALLQKIYPTKAIRAALIWTETPELMELSSQLLDDALARVTST
jgi:ATP-dependent helicase/nuclease subunit A